MDPSKSSSKHSNMSLPSMSIKYNVDHDELEEFYPSDTEKSSIADSSEETSKSKKLLDKSGSSILEKYFKAFKSDKTVDDDSKATDSLKDNSERKSSDLCSDVSDSPIKEYFSKLSKRSDSIDASGDTDSRDSKEKDVSDRWKLFSDFRDKIAQAVEEIKSSRSEGTDKQTSVDNSVTDSEENSLQQDLDPNSGASTENQLSSLASSVQNLSELSPPMISHSNTITDSDMDTSSPSDTHQNLTETGKQKKIIDDLSKIKQEYQDSSDDDNALEPEIESGVDALDYSDDLVESHKPSSVHATPTITSKPSMPIVPEENIFFTYPLFIFTSMVVFSLVIFPTILLFNGFLIGIWCVYVINKAQYWAARFLGHENFISKIHKDSSKVFDYSLMSIPNIPRIIEFTALKKYESWVNIYTLGKYDPMTYNIAQTQTVFMKLEGSTLRVSFTYIKVSKRALWDEKNYDNIAFYQHRIYDLEGARIKLLPVGIVKKRHWSKKYPICLMFKDLAKMTVYNTSSDEEVKPNVPSSPKSKVEDSSLAESDASASSPSESREERVEQSSEPLIKEKPSKLIEDSPHKEATSESKNSKHILITPSITKALQEIDEFKKKNRIGEVGTQYLLNSLEDFPEIEDEDCAYDDAMAMKDLSGLRSSDGLKSIETEGYDLEMQQGNWQKESWNEGTILYVFARTGREKDEWYRRLKLAIEEANAMKQQEQENLEENTGLDDPPSGIKPEDSASTETLKEKDSRVKVTNIKTEKQLIGSNEGPSVLWTPEKLNKDSILADSINSNDTLDFWRYMKDILETPMSHQVILPFSSTSEDSQDFKPELVQKSAPVENSSNSKKEFLKPIGGVAWLNSLLGRIVFDAFKNPYFVELLQNKIQKKLATIKLPTFMGPLVVTGLDLGQEAPRLHGAEPPWLDQQGLWAPVLLSYRGRATLTLNTKLNLMSLKVADIGKDDTSKVLGQEGDETNKEDKQEVEGSGRRSPKAVYHSDVEDTAEDDSTEDEGSPVHAPVSSTSEKLPTDSKAQSSPKAAAGNSGAKKFLKIVDKITSSKYFQQVTEYKYVKRAIEGVSNTELRLRVEVRDLTGVLIINMPPPPSDRIWFGFRANPTLVLKAKPVVGERVINIYHVTSWIEKRLCKEFEKLLVMPNMEDISLNIMIPPDID